MSRLFRMFVPVLVLLTLSLILPFDHTAADDTLIAVPQVSAPQIASSKVGINEGTIVGNEDIVIRTMRGEVINSSTGQPYVPNIEPSYILQMVTDRTNPQPAINFIIKANNEGLIPIIRLCYPDPAMCKFKSAAHIYGFYQQVAQALDGTNHVFVAALGPNEPGSGEAEAFGVANGDYATLVRWANNAAKNLQPYRVVNGGNMYLAPAIFNGSNSVPGDDDVRGYLYSTPSIKPQRFDFILTNLYNHNGKTARYFYTEKGRSMRNYVKNNPHLKTIVTETGFIRHAGNPTDLQNFRTAYAKLCSDTTISGILFFRPVAVKKLPPGYPAYTPRQTPSIGPSALQSIAQSCSA